MRKLAGFVLCGLATVLFVAPAVDAQDRSTPLRSGLDDRAAAIQLFDLDSPSLQPRRGWQRIPGAVEEFAIRTDPERISTAPKSVRFQLPDGVDLEALRSRFVTYRDDWKAWFGTLRPAGSDEAGTGYAFFGYHGEQLTGFLRYEGQAFQIVGGLNGEHRLVRVLDERGVRSCAYDLIDLPQEDDPGPVLPPTTGNELMTKTTTRIDVLAVYPKSYFSFPTSEVGVINWAHDSIAVANDIFDNSNVDAYYNLVHVGPLIGDQPPYTGIDDGIEWLTGEPDPVPTEVADLRDAFGADIVTMFYPTIYDDTNACGIANLPRPTSFYSGFRTFFETMGDRAFSVSRQSCGFDDYTLAHEIGHNFGMRHENETTSTSHLFPNGRGYEFTVSGSGVASVMACTCGEVGEPTCTVGSSPTCDRVPHFSDPAINYGGAATGTSTRNNAAVARSQKASYASFRSVSTNNPPDASFTASCSSGTCNFDASASSDDTGLPANAYHWDFGDGTTGTGKTPSHSYSGSFYWVHLVVTDDGGQRDFTLTTVSP